MCCSLLFQIFDSEAKDLEREVCFIDIACDEIPERYYKESEVSSRWDVVWKRLTHLFDKYEVQPSLGDRHLSLCGLSLVSHLAGFLILSLTVKSLFLGARHRPWLPLNFSFVFLSPQLRHRSGQQNVQRAELANMPASLTHRRPRLASRLPGLVRSRLPEGRACAFFASWASHTKRSVRPLVTNVETWAAHVGTNRALTAGAPFMGPSLFPS